MEEIVHAFGIDWRLIVIQMFNFAILLGALWYFLYTPVLNLLKEREAKIRKGVEDAKNAEIALNNAEKERAQVLRTAEHDAKDILQNAHAYAEERSEMSKQEAHIKAQTIIVDAEKRAKELALESKRDSEAEIVRVAILAAEKILTERQSA